MYAYCLIGPVRPDRRIRGNINDNQIYTTLTIILDSILGPDRPTCRNHPACLNLRLMYPNCLL